MNLKNDDLVDPDPFLLAAVCLQGAAVILQLIQIGQANARPSSSIGAIKNRISMLTPLETALDEFDAAIEKAERMIRRSSEAPTKEFYEASFRVSIGVLNFSSKNVMEYHNVLAETTAKLSALTRWIGHIIGQDPDIAAKIGDDINKVVNGSSERLNALMGTGEPIELVLTEAKLVRDTCRNAIKKHLDENSNS
jgi:hypothetical protein